MPESPEKKKKTKLKGVIPAEVTTLKAFNEAIENLRKYQENSNFLLKEIKIYERKMRMLDRLNSERNSSSIKEMEIFKKQIRRALAGLKGYSEYLLDSEEDAVEEDERNNSKENHSSDC